MSNRPRWHCTGCREELARSLQRGTVKFYPARVVEVYWLANGQHLLVCACGRRNLLPRCGKMLLAAPSDQEAQSVELTR